MFNCNMYMQCVVFLCCLPVLSSCVALTGVSVACLTVLCFPTIPTIDIPVFPTVTAVITLERYNEEKTQPHMFMVPRDYRKVSL